MQWIKCSERLPEEEITVLIYPYGYDRGSVLPLGKNRNGIMHEIDSPCLYERLNDPITHWMPFPEPPKDE